MRALKLITSDIRFQYKYGFYLLYAVFTVFYIFLLRLIPEEWKKTVVAVLIYSDPAAMGLFFMGAIILLEKSQRVLDSIAVSPVKVGEYIAAKVASLGFIGVLVGVIIAMTAKTGNLLLTLCGVILASVLFSLLGIIIAVKIKSLNQFVIATVPFLLILTAFPVLTLFYDFGEYVVLHPGVSAIRLIIGGEDNNAVHILVLLFWIILAWMICHSAVKKAFLALGGVKL
ncbi:MAG: ABC transporter permease [Firmicutes bacterium HGW-Firmicutes-21]|nr:MAG: ABC transporter permease [Firmicutes bacterium HGW-Firmicutes-21]